MIVNNTNYLEQIYDCVKNYEDVGDNEVIERTISNYKNNRITILRTGTFMHCQSLTTVDLPNVTSIGESSFESCISLTTVNLPNVTSIDRYAFYNCASLTTIDLPNVTSIEESAFSSCTSLTTLIIRTSTLCILDTPYAFGGTLIASDTGYIYVSKALISQYQTATNWSAYASQFRALEDYTIDGTTTGELDPNKI